jgi:hypothetical protein
MAAAPTTMDLVILRETIFEPLYVDALELRVAADAGTATEAIRKGCRKVGRHRLRLSSEA